MTEIGRAAERLGQNIKTGLTDVGQANIDREKRAREAEEKEFRRDEYNKMEPIRQLQVQTAQTGLDAYQTEQDRLNKPASFGSIFADQTDEQGNPVLSARVLEHASWSRKVRENDPAAKKILKKPMMDAVADIFGAKYMTEGPKQGQYVRENGSVVSEREKEQKFEEIKALFLARTNEGRLIRHMKEKAEEEFHATGDMEAYQADLDEITKIESDTTGRIQRLQKKIEILKQFKTKEAKAGIERAEISIKKLFSKLSEEEAALLGGSGEKDLSPSQQIQQMRLNALKILTNPAAPMAQKKKAAGDLQKITGKDSRKEAITALVTNPGFVDLSKAEKSRQIAELEQLFTEAKISTMADVPAPGPDMTSINSILEGIRNETIDREEGKAAIRQLQSQNEGS